MASIKKLTKDKKSVLIMVLVKIQSPSHSSCSGLRIVSGLAESLSSGGSGTISRPSASANSTSLFQFHRKQEVKARFVPIQSSIHT